MIVQIATILALATCAASFDHEPPYVLSAEGPDCGSEAGGSRLIVHGERFNVSRTLEVTVIHWPADGDRWEHVQCVVTVRDDSRAACLTGPSSGRTSDGRRGTVIVRFDDTYWLTVPQFEFRYAAHPRIEPNQTLRGNGEEGCHVRVRLVQPLQCAEDVSLYAVDDSNELQHAGYDQCSLNAYNDRLLYCPAPVLRRYGAAQNRDFACGLYMRFAGRPIEVVCDPSTVYIVRRDPSFKYVETRDNDGRLYIFGPDLKNRLRTADGVYVWIQLHGEHLPCPAERLDDDDTLVCTAPKNIDYDDITEVMVSLGSMVHIVPHHYRPTNV